MPDDLYETDILAWSLTQAERLRRVAAGERVNDVDWAHVIEEVEDVGRSEFNSAVSNFTRAVEHALKIVAWPNHWSRQHWMQEIATHLGNARAHFEGSMIRKIDVPEIYRKALKAVRKLDMDASPGPLPEAIELTADDLRDDDFGARDLVDRIRAALPPG